MLSGLAGFKQPRVEGHCPSSKHCCHLKAWWIFSQPTTICGSQPHLRLSLSKPSTRPRWRLEPILEREPSLTNRQGFVSTPDDARYLLIGGSSGMVWRVNSSRLWVATILSTRCTRRCLNSGCLGFFRGRTPCCWAIPKPVRLALCSPSANSSPATTRV
jgi:hypothetical protein